MSFDLYVYTDISDKGMPKFSWITISLICWNGVCFQRFCIEVSVNRRQVISRHRNDLKERWRSLYFRLPKATFKQRMGERENGETGDGQRRTRNGERATENGQRRTGNGERATGNGQRGAGNEEREMRNGQRGTGNGKRAPENGEREMEERATGNGEWEMRNEEWGMRNGE